MVVMVVIVLLLLKRQQLHHSVPQESTSAENRSLAEKTMAALPNLEAQMQYVMHQLSWDVVANPIVNVGMNYQV